MKKVNLSTWIPKGKFGNYYFYWFSDNPENCDHGTVGVVKNFSDPETRIRIVIDDPWMAENNQRGCCLQIVGDFYKDSFIIITKEFFDNCMDENEECQFSLWHEIGHYHTIHYFPEYQPSNGSAIRRAYIEKGKIAPAEYAADLFGLYYAGEKATLSSLLTLSRSRYKLVDQDDYALLACHELRQRRRVLREFHDNENDIIHEIVVTCGVDSENDI